MDFKKDPPPAVWFYSDDSALCGSGHQARAVMQQALADIDGIQITEDPDSADYITLVACGDRGLESILQRLKLIKHIVGERATKIVLAGCAANIGPDSVDWDDVQDFIGASIIIAKQDKGETRTDALLRVLDQDRKESISDLTVDPELYYGDLDQQSLYIQHTCHNGCWYCSRAATIGKAPLTEAPLDEVKSAVDKIKNQGIRNLHIGGTNISLYKRLPELIQYIQSLDHFDSVEISGAAPQNIRPETIAAINQPVVSRVEITCDVTDPDLMQPMRHMTMERLESIYSQVDPQKSIVTNLMTNLPGEKTGDAFGDQVRRTLSRNHLFTRSISSFVPAAVQMLQQPYDAPESYVTDQFSQAMTAAESVNQEIIDSYRDKFMTVRVSRIVTGPDGTKFAHMNMFGHDFILSYPMTKEVLEGCGLGSELQVGDVVNVMINGQSEQDLETFGGSLADKSTKPPYGYSKSRYIRFCVKGIERSDRRPSCKRYDTYDEMIADNQDSSRSAEPVLQ